MRFYVYDIKVDKKIFPASEGRKERIVYDQSVYVDVGGRFPVEIKVPIESSESFYKIGEYIAAPESFVVDKYKTLSIDPYRIKLTLVSQSLTKS